MKGAGEGAKRGSFKRSSTSDLRRPGGLIEEDPIKALATFRRGASSGVLRADEDELDEEDEPIDCTVSSCMLLCGRCGRRAGGARRAATAAVKEEAYEAWGKTKTARRLGVLRRKWRCPRRRPSRDSLQTWRNSLRGVAGRAAAVAPKGSSSRRASRDEAIHESLKKGANNGGFGVQCFIIHNPGHLQDYFEIVDKEIGVGGSAKIYKAVERSTHVERAVKKIYKLDPTELSRGVQEVSTMKALDHPNIAKLFETFQDEKHLYLVMELCGGGDLLDKLLDNGTYNEVPAATVVRTVLMALNYMHANGYVHRDIKLENVMFKDARRDCLTSALRLVDFGFACQLPEDDAPMTMKVGSPYYVAPEILEGEYDARCDIWSVGVLTYILLCGHPPFVGETDADTLHQIRDGKYYFRKKHWQEISRPAKHFVRHLVEADREKRMSMTDALGHPWLKVRGAARVDRMRDETVDRLLAFNTYHKLRRAAMLAVAYQLEAHDVRELVELFQGLDLNGDGLLTSPEFIKGVQACGIDTTWITRMMKSVDADNSGVIDFCEFLAATLEQDMYIKNHAALYRAFRSFDQDDSGNLSRDEIAETLCMTDEAHAEEVQEFFEDVDLNGDGCMDYGEFYSLLQREIDPEKTVFQAEDEIFARRRGSKNSQRSSRTSGSSMPSKESARLSSEDPEFDVGPADTGDEHQHEDVPVEKTETLEADDKLSDTEVKDSESEDDPSEASGSSSASSGSSNSSGSGSRSASGSAASGSRPGSEREEEEPSPAARGQTGRTVSMASSELSEPTAASPTSMARRGGSKGRELRTVSIME